MSQAGRPKKVRYIQKMPGIVQFSPRGKPGRPDSVELTVDEFEAFKLADLQDFTQEQGAVAMHVSRPTFGRLLRSARKKAADGLVNGKIIKISIGDVQVGVRKKEMTVDRLGDELDRWKTRNKRMAEEIGEISEDKPGV